MGKDIIITKEIALRAVLFGACRIPKVGENIKCLSQSDLFWAEKILFPRERKALKIPLWCCGYGDGDGTGNGDGDVFGNGDGDGDGDGNGYGDGFGDGDGYSDGYGFGDGFGNGDGTGYGFGNGDGNGYGIINKAINKLVIE